MAQKSSDRLAKALHAMTDHSQDTSEPVEESSVPTEPSSIPVPQTHRPSRPAKPNSPKRIGQSMSPPRTLVDSKQSSAKPRSRKSRVGSLEFRRTLIPPCLVVGTCFIGFMMFFFLQPDDAALRQVRGVVPVGIGIIGCLLLGVGVFNMLLVKNELDFRRNHTDASKV